MSKIKEFFYKLYLSNYFPFFLLILFFSLFNMFIHLDTADDVWFRQVLDSTDKLTFLYTRWNNWSSRLIIEYFLVTLVRMQFIWRILNTVMYVLLIYSIRKLISLKNIKEINLFFSSLVLLLPVELYKSAGWIATNLNYFWPLTLGLFSLIPIRKAFDGEKINWYEYIFYFLASAYSLNQEQSCIILFITYFVFLIYIYKIKKKLNFFILIQFVFSLISLFLTLICPGNYARKIAETSRWFPEFNNIPFLRKLEMGFSSSIFEFAFNSNTLFLLFCILLAFCMFLKCKDVYSRIVSLFPLAVSLVFGFLSPILSEVFPGIRVVKNSMTKYGTGITLHSVTTFIPDIILTLVCISVIISLYKIFETRKSFILSALILFLGFISHMILSFSPTIWASGTRTYIFMYFSFLICALLLFKEIYILYSRQLSLVLISEILSLISIINLVYYNF